MRLARAWWRGLRLALAPPGAVKTERTLGFAAIAIGVALAGPWAARQGWPALLGLGAGAVLLLGALFAPIAAALDPEQDPARRGPTEPPQP